MSNTDKIICAELRLHVLHIRWAHPRAGSAQQHRDQHSTLSDCATAGGQAASVSDT